MEEITFKALLNILDSGTKVKIRINILNLEFETTHRAEHYKTKYATEYSTKQVTDIWTQTDGTLVVTLKDT